MTVPFADKFSLNLPFPLATTDEEHWENYKEITRWASRRKESVPVDQTGAIALATSNDFICRDGGEPQFLISLITALTVAGEVKLYRNGTLFATEAVPISSGTPATGGPIILGPWHDVVCKPLDTLRVEISNAGTSGTGFHGEWWLG